MDTSRISTDVVVVGLGPAGEALAGQLAAAGLDVVGVERELVGGECPYWACVPSKMMVRAAGLVAEAGRVDGMAGKATVEADWEPLARRIRSEATSGWDDRQAAERLEGRGCQLIRGEARLVGPGTVQVGGQLISASRGVVIATGASPQIPDIPGLDGTPFWTNREAVATPVAPPSLVVLGGGPVGLELGQVLARFGTAVTVVEAGERLLGPEEPEAGELLARVLDGAGIEIHCGATVRRVDHDGERFSLDLEGEEPLVAERLLVATGRRPDLERLGVAAVGLDPDAGAIEVDGRLRAGAGLWAVGDVTGEGAFTHVGLYQAEIAAADILGRDHEPASYHAVPRVTFTDPEVGAVGMTERQAREAGVAVESATVDLAASARGWILGPGNDGLIKLVADGDHGTLVGATAVGPSGGEVLGLLALAVHARVPLTQLRSMIWAYPTFHRAIAEAVTQLTGD